VAVSGRRSSEEQTIVSGRYQDRFQRQSVTPGRGI
jgi:hypothetical protein